MSISNQYAVNLKALNELTITADANSSGYAVRIVSGSEFSPTFVAANSSATIGPYAEDRIYNIVSESGNLSYSTAITTLVPTTQSSAALAGRITDETGTGKVVFNTSPTLITPVLGVASATTLTASDGLVVPKTAGKGIKVDVASPTFGWADLKGIAVVDTSGVNAPVIAEYRTGVFDLGYNASDKQYYRFHVEHTDITGGNKYIHAHIRHNGTSITGNLVLTFVISHQYGFNRSGSPAPITITQTIPAASLIQHDTYIEDTLFMQSGGGVGLLDSDNYLVDDDILVTMTVTTLPTISGGLSNRIFIPHVDIHREVNGILGTKNKDPLTGGFYA